MQTTAEVGTASAEDAEQPQFPAKRKKVIHIHPTDQTTQEPEPPKVHPATVVPRERKARVYEPPDISEYLNPAKDAHNSDAWLEYRKWNRALSSFFLLNSHPAAAAYLTITPRLAAAAWQKAEGITLTPEEALKRFATAVGALYEREVLSQTPGLKILRCSAPDAMPLCTAFLSLAVLAAYTMRTDGGYSANAYYARLADLLVAHSSNNDSLPFDQDEYYALWAYLQNWLRQRTGAVLPLPARDESARFYVGFPRRTLSTTFATTCLAELTRLPMTMQRARQGP
jgi:hypothetical protein